MADDVSNKTVLVLVILTILISTLGTFTVTSSVRNYQDAQVPVYDNGPQSGKVTLKLNNMPEAEPIVSSPATGNVIFIPVSGDGE
ncbi:hypothetical protein JXA48_01570 [Candidatus Woesearchaeota archaeon]|nr:hypothetical protein [Candidatus Woesearchaeota archaeon]